MFECDKCKEQFDNQAELNKHQDRKRKVPCDLMCDKCSTKLKSRYAYAKHIKSCIFRYGDSDSKESESESEQEANDNHNTTDTSATSQSESESEQANHNGVSSESDNSDNSESDEEHIVPKQPSPAAQSPSFEPLPNYPRPAKAPSTKGRKPKPKEPKVVAAPKVVPPKSTKAQKVTKAPKATKKAPAKAVPPKKVPAVKKAQPKKTQQQQQNRNGLPQGVILNGVPINGNGVRGRVNEPEGEVREFKQGQEIVTTYGPGTRKIYRVYNRATNSATITITDHTNTTNQIVVNPLFNVKFSNVDKSIPNPFLEEFFGPMHTLFTSYLECHTEKLFPAVHLEFLISRVVLMLYLYDRAPYYVNVWIHPSRARDTQLMQLVIYEIQDYMESPRADPEAAKFIKLILVPHIIKTHFADLYQRAIREGWKVIKELLTNLNIPTMPVDLIMDELALALGYIQNNPLLDDGRVTVTRVS